MTADEKAAILRHLSDILDDNAASVVITMTAGHIRRPNHATGTMEFSPHGGREIVITITQSLGKEEILSDPLLAGLVRPRGREVW
jgi:hypothetical protein